MILVVLIGVAVLVLLVAWLSDRRDLAGGQGRWRSARDVAVDARTGRQAVKWRGRSLANRGLVPMDTGDEERDLTP